jgi:hypothetical protein
MNIILSILKIHIPEILKKRKIKELFEITGKAFQCDIPPLKGLSYEALLKGYAVFAREKSEKIIRESGNIQEIKDRLNRYAFEAGAKLRKTLFIKGTKDIMDASRLFYSVLGIEFTGSDSNEIVIRRCYFSEYFSPEVCYIISSLDEGVAEGISSGNKLCFIHRITEGKDSCKAILK